MMNCCELVPAAFEQAELPVVPLAVKSRGAGCSCTVHGQDTGNGKEEDEQESGRRKSAGRSSFRHGTRVFIMTADGGSEARVSGRGGV